MRLGQTKYTTVLRTFSSHDHLSFAQLIINAKINDQMTNNHNVLIVFSFILYFVSYRRSGQGQKACSSPPVSFKEKFFWKCLTDGIVAHEKCDSTERILENNISIHQNNELYFNKSFIQIM